MTQNAIANKEAQNDLGTPEWTRDNPVFTPRVDILETDHELTLFADMPGVKPDGVDIRFEKGELTVHGRCAPRTGAGNAVWQEYGVGDFFRTFSVSEAIDPDKITAELKQGVLTVHLPKREAVKPKKITIKGE